jgi:hypothetical protein
VKTLESIFTAAKADLAQYISAQLQYNANESGWPDALVQGINVNFDNSSLSLGVNDNVYDEVMTREYGTERVRPTSVIRRTGNMSYEFEKHFIERVDARLRRMK